MPKCRYTLEKILKYTSATYLPELGVLQKSYEHNCMISQNQPNEFCMQVLKLQGKNS